MTDIARSIEALLFYSAEPVRISELARILRKSRTEVDAALTELRASLDSHGIRLLEHADEVSLVTAPETSALIEEAVKEELSKDLSRASLETLSIILYMGPLTRGEIDHVRGVNSTFILRNLMIRGLVEKLDNPNDQRSFLYRATSDTLRFLGITRVEDLPNYQETKERIAAILTHRGEESAEHAGADENNQSPTVASEQAPNEVGVVPESDEMPSETTENEVEDAHDYPGTDGNNFPQDHRHAS